MDQDGITLADLGLTRLDHAGPEADPDAVIGSLAADSRKVTEGTLFFALPGTQLDGASFAQFAVRQGASAVVISPAGLETAKADIGDLPVPFFLTQHLVFLSRQASTTIFRRPGWRGESFFSTCIHPHLGVWILELCSFATPRGLVRRHGCSHGFGAVFFQPAPDFFSKSF